MENKNNKKFNLLNFNINWRIEEEDESRFESNISKSYKNIISNPLIKLNDKLYSKNKVNENINCNKINYNIQDKLDDYWKHKMENILKNKMEDKISNLLSKLQNLNLKKKEFKNEKQKKSMNKKIQILENIIDSILLKNGINNNNFKRNIKEKKVKSIKLNLNNLIDKKKLFNLNRVDNNKKAIKVKKISNKTLKQKANRKSNYYLKEIKETQKILKL